MKITLGFACLSCLLLGVIIGLVSSRPSPAQTARVQPSSQILKAREIILQDAEGRSRIILSADSPTTHEAFIYLNSPIGLRGISLQDGPNNIPALFFTNAKGNAILGLNGNDKRPSIDISDPTGNPKVLLECKSETGAVMTRDAGNHTATLGSGGTIGAH